MRWIDDHYLALHIQQHQEAIQPSLVIAIGIPKFVSVTGFCLFSGRLSFLPQFKNFFFFVSQSGEVSIQNFFRALNNSTVFHCKTLSKFGRSLLFDKRCKSIQEMLSGALCVSMVNLQIPFFLNITLTWHSIGSCKLYPNNKEKCQSQYHGFACIGILN